MSADQVTSGPGAASDSGADFGLRLAARVKPQVALHHDRLSNRLVGAVGRASLGFGRAIGRASAIRPTVTSDDLNTLALQPPVGFWRRTEPEPLVSAPARTETPRSNTVRRMRTAGVDRPTRSWTDRLISGADTTATRPSVRRAAAPVEEALEPSGDARWDQLRALFAAGVGPDEIAARNRAPRPAGPTPDRSRGLLDAARPGDSAASATDTTAIDVDDAAESDDAAAPGQAVDPSTGERGDTAAGPLTGPGRLAETLRPEPVSVDEVTARRSRQAASRAATDRGAPAPPRAPGAGAAGRPGSAAARGGVQRGTPRRGANDPLDAIRRFMTEQGEPPINPTDVSGPSATTDQRADPSARRDVASGGRADPSARRDVASGGRADPSVRRDVASGGRADPSARRDVASGGRADPSARRDVASGGRADPSARRDVASGGQDRADHGDNTGRPPGAARSSGPGVDSGPATASDPMAARRVVHRRIAEDLGRPSGTDTAGPAATAPFADLAGAEPPTLISASVDALDIAAGSGTEPPPAHLVDPTRLEGLDAVGLASVSTGEMPLGAAHDLPTTASVETTGATTTVGLEARPRLRRPTYGAATGLRPVLPGAWSAPGAAPAGAIGERSIGTPAAPSEAVLRRVTLPRAMSADHRPLTEVSLVVNDPLTPAAPHLQLLTDEPHSPAESRLVRRGDASQVDQQAVAVDRSATLMARQPPVSAVDVDGAGTAAGADGASLAVGAGRPVHPGRQRHSDQHLAVSVQPVVRPELQRSASEGDTTAGTTSRNSPRWRPMGQPTTGPDVRIPLAGHAPTVTPGPGALAAALSTQLALHRREVAHAPSVEAAVGNRRRPGLPGSVSHEVDEPPQVGGAGTPARLPDTDQRSGTASPESAAALKIVDSPSEVVPVEPPAQIADPTPPASLAQQFMTELSATVQRSPAPLPMPFRPLADVIAGPRRVLLSTDETSRRALRSVGKVAATTGETIHLDPDPIPSARLHEVMAHELTHVAHPSATPRFFDDVDDSPEERRAEQMAAVIARSPVAPTASTVSPVAGGLVARRAKRSGGVVQRSAAASGGDTIHAAAMAAQLTGAKPRPTPRPSVSSTSSTAGDVIRRTEAPSASLSGTGSASGSASGSTADLASSSAGADAFADLEATSDPRSDRDDRVIDDEFVGALRRNISRVLDLIGDRITIEREHRGGREWGGF